MSKARDRRQKRRQRDSMAKRANSTVRQIVPEGRFKLPEIKLTGGRWLIFVPVAVILFFGVIWAIGRFKPAEAVSAPNAIWLDASWSHAERSDEDLARFVLQLRANQVGHVFVYVSSLKNDVTWSGLATGNNRVTEVEPLVEAFVNRLRTLYPDIKLYAWVEVNVTNRLDNLQVQGTVANFANRMVTNYDFDGVLIDAKPIFTDNDDYLALLRRVRDAVGFDTPLLVTISPDFTPEALSASQPSQIAPGTEWSAEFKQSVALLADQMIITAYNSYRDDPVTYIEWVAYQVTSTIEAISELESTSVLISIPNYDGAPPAHYPQVETISSALDGVLRGTQTLTEDTAPILQGVAIFSDRDLNTTDWNIYSGKWLN